MSSDKQRLESLFEELKTKALKAFDELEKLEAEAEELRVSRREAEEKSWAAEEKLKETEAELQEKSAKLESLQESLAERTREADTLKEDIAKSAANKDQEIDAIRRERDELRTEMNQINAQLEKVSELYRETAAEKEKLQEKVDVSDLLAIYILLIEKIFGGKPHARVLYTLHNTKTAISRKNIESSTGIMPTAVIKAIHDLRNADLVSFNEETQEVKLIKDIL
ncbi:MAG: hypothetical protein ACFFEF_17320 [Candidatus Thorarchaeota archaeon]